MDKMNSLPTATPKSSLWARKLVLMALRADGGGDGVFDSWTGKANTWPPPLPSALKRLNSNPCGNSTLVGSKLLRTMLLICAVIVLTSLGESPVPAHHAVDVKVLDELNAAVVLRETYLHDFRIET